MLRSPTFMLASIFGLLLGAPLHLWAAPAQNSAPITDLSPYQGQDFLLVRNSTREAADRIDLVLLQPDTRQVKARMPTALQCQRVHIGGQTILCLGTPRRNGANAPAAYRVTDWKLQDRFAGTAMRGVTVSRARVSPDGAYASATTFTNGHAYTVGPDEFATETLILDVKQRSVLLPTFDLWKIVRGQEILPARNLSFWGVSFHPQNPDQFYLTVAVGMRPYLGKGSFSTRRVELILPDVECPSISPDGKHLAFKKRKGLGWVPAILNMSTQAETVFTNNANVDDQIEWLDNATLIFERNTPRMAGVKTDLVTLDINKPQSTARVWLSDAGSPAVARPARH